MADRDGRDGAVMGVLLTVILIAQAEAFSAQAEAFAAQTPRELEQQLQRHHEQTQIEFHKQDEERRVAIQEVKEEIQNGFKAIPEVVNEIRLLRVALEASRPDERTAATQVTLDIVFKAMGVFAGMAYAIAKGVYAAKRAFNGQRGKP